MNVLTKNIIILLFLFLFAGYMTSCKSKKVIETKPQNIILKNFDTDLIINYRLDKAGVRDTFNRAIDDALSVDLDMLEYGFTMDIKKKGNATVEIEGKNILVVVPIDILIEKKTFVTNLSGRGTIEMSFVTAVDIDSLWNLSTQTELAYHRWLDKPKMSVFGVSLPIETIADAVVKKSKTMIENSIDESVRDNFTLRSKMYDSMKIFDDPFRIAPEMNGWIYIQPTEFRMSEIKNSVFSAIGKIQIKGVSTFTTYEPEVNKTIKPLPKMYWTEDIPDSTVFRVAANIKTMDINPMLKQNLEGKTFREGSNTITLSNIVTNCDYEYLKVVTDVTGTLNGTLIFKGKPNYNSSTNEFYLDDTHIEFRTKNIIHKVASWLAKGKIKKELERNLSFPISSYLQAAQENIDKELKKINDQYDIEMRIGVGSADVESFELQPGEISTILKTKFHLEARVKDFRSFSKF